MADQKPKEKAKRILKLKKTPVLEAPAPTVLPAPVPEPAALAPESKPKAKRVLKLKKTEVPIAEAPASEAVPSEAVPSEAVSVAEAPASEPKAKRSLKLKTKLLELPVFPGETVERYTDSWQAIDLVREWFADRDEPVPQAEIKFAIEMLEADRQMKIKAAEEDAKPKKPVLGPMPEYGSQDFWKWCRMRKAIKEAELKEKGLPIPEPKPKKPRKKKEPKA